MFGRKEKTSSDGKTLEIAFITGSGYGDTLVFANYLQCLRKRFSMYDMCFDVYLSAGFKSQSTIFAGTSLCRNVMKTPDIFPSEKYDCVIWFSRYPKVEYVRHGRVKSLAGLFYDYIQRCQAFYEREHYIFDNSPNLDGLTGIRCIMSGTSRLQQPDFDGTLEIGKEFEFRAVVNGDPTAFLKEHGMDRPFITFHRGNDVAYGGDAVKLWPLGSYVSLIRMVKERYPDYLTVQIGVSRERCPHMDGVDIDLVGQTTMEDVKGMMMYSSLHVDAEGGFVHLRRCLMGGQSVVLFGPTSKRLYAYDGNINITGDGCDTPCEWVTKDWISSCPRGFAHPPCMTSISPEDVMARIESEWKGGGR